MSKLGPEFRNISLAASVGLSVLLSACSDKGDSTPTLAPAVLAGATTPGSESICGEESSPIPRVAQLTQRKDYTSADFSMLKSGVRAVAFGEKAVFAGLATKPGESGGLLAFTGQDWRVCTNKPTQINDIAVKGNGIGLATDPQRNIANEPVGGAWLLDKGNWTNYGSKDGVDPRGYAIVLTNKGALYGAWNGAYGLVYNTWERAFTDLHLPQVHSIYARPDSKETWFGLLDKGVIVVDQGITPTTSVALTAPDKLGGNKVRDVAGTRDGKIVAVATDKDEGKDGGGVTLYDESGKVMKIINSQTTPGALDHIIGVAIEERKRRAPRIWGADYLKGVTLHDLETGESVLYDSKPAYSVAVCADGCPNIELTNTVVIGYVEPMFTVASLPASGSVGIAIPKESPTPVLAPANTDFKIKEFSAGPPNKDGIVEVQLCTENRPLGATIRMKLYEELDGEIVTVEGLLKRVSILDWESGGPCTDTGANPDHLKLVTKNFPPGKYELLGQGRPPEAKVEAGEDIWTSPTVQSQIIPLTIR